MALQETLIKLCILLPIGYVIGELLQKNIEAPNFYYAKFGVLLAICTVSYQFCLYCIPPMRQLCVKAGLHGRDINKKGTPEGEVDVPESLGIASATIFIAVATIGILYQHYFEPELVLPHMAAILSTTYAVFLGFCDDVFDLRWRHKLWLPAVATLPLLVAYSGVTFVVVPVPLRVFLGGAATVELGLLYYLYMTALTVFCTNSINIYAGINGLEVGQSLIIGAAILLHNTIEIFQSGEIHIVPLSSDTVIAQHKFSLMLISLYLAVTLALYHFNKYPSRVFVGDTFCYWSGMVFAVLGILGHFQKTLLLFFIPQILNFVYGLPQLLKIIPCPRHRLPTYNIKTKQLEAIKSNLNLINLFLWIFGPMSEKALSTLCVVFQIFCCALGFFIRYGAKDLLY